MLVVETAVPDDSSGGGILRVLAEELWRGRAETVSDAHDILRRRWGGHRDADLIPLPARAEASIRVEGRPVAFDVVSQPGHWVGRAAIRGCQLTVEGYDVPLEGLALVEIASLDPHIHGSRRFEGDRYV